MKKFLLPLAMLAIVAVPASANAAAACRNAKGQFAKCGTPGAMSDAQYRAMKGKPAAAVKPVVAAKPAVAAAAAKPAAAARAMPCKDAKGKFIKCATMAKPAAKK